MIFFYLACIVKKGKKKLRLSVINVSFPKSIMETCSVVLTFESVDEILWM